MKVKGQSKLFRIMFLVLVFLAISLIPVYAQSVDELRQEQQKNQDEISEQKDKIDDLKEQEGSVLDEVKKIAANIARLETELVEINDQLEQLELEVNQAEEELAEAEAELDERSKILGERVKTIYQNGTVGYIEVLFQAESFSDFLSRLEFLRKIAQQDSELVEEIKIEREEISVKKTELESDQAKMELLQQRVAANKEELDRQKDLEEEKLSLLKADRKEAEKEQAQLEADNKRIEELIRQKLTPVNRGDGSPAVGTGRLTWPVPGYSRVSSGYGYRTHPIFGTKGSFHSGIDIPAPTESKLAAADSGTIIYAGVMGGYGKTVIIDHGDGISTLYGHMNSIDVSSGQAVSKGQRIGGIGSTGWSTGPHVHFEVRISGKHTNPWPYLN